MITDLDNTLFDWVDIWYSSFSAMLDSLVRKSGVPRQTLISEAREIHQRVRTSEYAFLIEELPSLQRKNQGSNLAEVYSDAIQAFQNARASALKLYPGVKETLEFLKNRETSIVGYTESQEFYSLYRIRHLGLDGLLDVVYTPPDHPFPAGITRDGIRRHPADEYRLKKTQHRHTPEGELKPNPGLLADIVKETGGALSGTIYIGDSLMKDIAMAQAAQVIDVYAKYGKAQNRPEYQLLREVTHWTDQDVQRERELTKADVKPSYELINSFAEVLELFDFIPFESRQIV